MLLVGPTPPFFLSSDTAAEAECLAGLTIDKMLASIHVVRCTNYTQLLALVNQLR